MHLGQAAFDEAVEEIRRRSRKEIYKTDFDAWSSDILGRRYYEKLRYVNSLMVAGEPRVAVKSANGCGKSMWLSDWGTYWSTVWPPEDSLAIFTANGRQQIQIVVFKYLKDNYGYAATHGNPFVGQINESLEWKYSKPDGSGMEVLAFGKRPADQDIVSSFQGTRKLRTFVGMDEAGGLPLDIYTAAEAVTTGDESMTVAIGNPDRRATQFHSIFTDPKLMAEWSRHTISAYDLPTMTGEIVYPNDPEKQQRMLKGLTSAKWIYHKERAWKTGGEIFFDEDAYEGSTVADKKIEEFKRNITGKKTARFLAKVDGEFPGETDNSFFPEEVIDKARDTDIDPTGSKTFIGADLAAEGEDESVVYVNRGGHIRLFEGEVMYQDGLNGELIATSGVWSKEDEVTSARRIHAIAMHLGADEVRLDAAGLGGGIASMLNRLDEFADKCYTIVRLKGSFASSDKVRWNNARAEQHDNLRGMMHNGLIDLDPADELLRKELLIITYESDNHGAVKITKKKEMKTEIGGSPDRLDAVIYSAFDATALTENPLGDMEKGQVVQLTPHELLMQSRYDDDYPV